MASQGGVVGKTPLDSQRVPSPSGFLVFERPIDYAPGLTPLVAASRSTRHVLHLANHSESAVFWWQIAAGAEHTGAACCLHLCHLSQGEIREAALGKRQMSAMHDRTAQQWFDGPPNDCTRDLVGAVNTFTAHCVRHREPAPIPTRHLQKRYEALADRHDEDGLVSRPDSRLTDRVQELTTPR